MGQEREREDGDREVENSPEIYGRLLWSTDWITEGETRWIIHEDTGPCVYVCVTCWWHTHTNVSQAALGQLIYEERGRQATNNVWTVTIISKNKGVQKCQDIEMSSYWMWSLIKMWKHINNIRLIRYFTSCFLLTSLVRYSHLNTWPLELDYQWYLFSLRS